MPVSAHLVKLRLGESDNTKVCTTCEVVQPLTSFYKYPGEHKDVTSMCKSCRRRYIKSRANRNRGKQLEAKYGLSLEGYNALLQQQANACALCGSEIPGHPSGHFVVDHNHNTGVIRGLLCTGCNVGLGHFRDNPALLLAAFGYLINDGEWSNADPSEFQPVATDAAGVV